MSSATFEKVLSSAVLTSCAVFSVLTLAFVPNQPEPLTAELPSLLERGLSSAEEISHRDSVIRHIGVSIVVSVGAGITTAELLRKWGRSRELSLTKQQALSAEMVLQNATVFPNFAANLRHELVKPLHRTAKNSIASDPSAVERDVTAVLDDDRNDTLASGALPLFLFQPSTAHSTDDDNWFPLQGSDAPLSEPLPELPLVAVDTYQPLTSYQVLGSREQYQTCRIYLPAAPERLFAILFEGQYYRLVRTAVAYEQACSVAAILDQKGETVVMTESEERYAIWALEPEAFPEAIAPTSGYEEA